MFGLKLFLGFAPDEPFQKELTLASPYLVSLLIGKDPYLHQVVQDGKVYLGKFLESYPTVEEIKDLEKHLLSLLRKLTPRYLFQERPPVLMTLPDGN